MCLKLVFIGALSASWAFAAPDKIVCYHESWSNWRPATGKFDVSNIDTKLCTHVIYSSVGVQPDDGSIQLKSDDSSFLYAYGILRTGNPRPKLLASINDWNDLSLIAANSNRRNAFLNSSINFLKQYCFDGIDFNLEDLGGSKCDSTSHNNIATLLDYFRDEFNKDAYLLTASVSPSTNNYNVPAIIRNLDFVNVKTNQFQGARESATGHNLAYSETIKIINAWKNAGTPPDKLILGVSAYGYSYKLQNNNVGAPMFVPGDAGTYTQEGGSLSYLEICQKIKNGTCAYKWNDVESIAYVNCGGDQWVIYDNTDSALKKAKFALENNLGGVFIWSVNTDDFNASCEFRYPLLNAIKRAMDGYECVRNYPQTGNVICYHAVSSYKRLGNGRFAIGDIDPKLCTHINFVTIGINYDGAILLTAEDNSLLSQYGILKSKNPKVKLLLTIGGKREGSVDVWTVAISASGRQKLLTGALNLMKRYNFDGVDFVWDYRSNNTLEKVNFALLLSKFREEFNKYCYLLTAAVLPTVQYYNVRQISEYLDFVNVMTFDFHGPWESRTGHNSPFTESAKSIVAWNSAGMPSNKLVLGIAAYGRSFTLLNINNTGIRAPAKIGVGGPYTGEPGILGYNEICEKLNSGWTRNWSSEESVPYAYRFDQWVSYDDADSAAVKAKFVVDRMGGVMVWTIDTDDFRAVSRTRYPILSAVNTVMLAPKVLELHEESTATDADFLNEEKISN